MLKAKRKGVDFLARKRKRNARITKEQTREIKKKDIILYKAATEQVIIPDFVQLSKKKQRATGEAFVHTSCVQDRVSLPLVCGACSVPAREGAGKRKQRSRQSHTTSNPFVPISCITPSTTPVCHFYGKSVEQTKLSLPPKKRYKRKRSSGNAEFVPASCITAHVSPGGSRNNRARPGNNCLFIPECCITADVSKPYLPAVKTEKSPAITYRYIDRPNSPDILGPANKKNKRKRTNGVPFVPKSCTIDTEKPAPAVLPRNEALAKPAPETQPREANSIGWLPVGAFVLVILVIIGYLFYK